MEQGVQFLKINLKKENILLVVANTTFYFGQSKLTCRLRKDEREMYQEI